MNFKQAGGVTHYIPDRAELVMQGVCTWDNHKNKYRILRVHYTADPGKRSAEWLASMQRGQLANPHSWGQEMEIDPFALSGTRMYEEFSRAHIIDNMTAAEMARMCEREKKPPPTWYFGLDYGGRMSPTAGIWIVVGPSKIPIIAYEHYETGWTIEANSKAMLALEKVNGIKPRYRVLDPNAWNDTHGDGRHIARQYAENKIICVEANNSLDYGVEVIRKALTGDENGPRLYVMRRCVNTIREFELYRHKEFSERELMSADPVDRPLDKNNHAMDSVRYVMVENPTYSNEWPAEREDEDDDKPRRARSRSRRGTHA